MKPISWNITRDPTHHRQEPFVTCRVALVTIQWTPGPLQPSSGHDLAYSSRSQWQVPNRAKRRFFISLIEELKELVCLKTTTICSN